MKKTEKMYGDVDREVVVCKRAFIEFTAESADTETAEVKQKLPERCFQDSDGIRRLVDHEF